MRGNRDQLLALAWTMLAALCVAGTTLLMLRHYEAADPWLLWGFLAIGLIAVMHVLRAGRHTPHAILPTFAALAKGPQSLLAWMHHLPMALGLAGASLLLLALARPQSKDSWRDVKREGIDIVIALDVSTSMLAKDLRPDRLEASKRVGMDFIDARPDDRIGLVVYEGEAFTQCPLTTDHRVLKELFAQAHPGLIDGGTAIGMGLSTALNRLRESEAKSKVVILLTDGVNNAGMVQPLDAARMAATLGIRLYTIGVGTRGKALSPVQRYPDGQFRYDYLDVNIDDAILQQMADLAGGRYFRATDENKLQDIYSEIDQLEKTRIQVTEHNMRNEEFHSFALAGALLLLGGFLLDRSILRTLA